MATILVARRTLLLGSLMLLIPEEAEAQRDPCAQYYGRGYCTDYVNQRTGGRQRGDAGSWPSNIGRISVRRGDVAIFRRQNHVAFVEEVTEWGTRIPSARDRYPVRLRISEMNYGRRASGTPRECYVTVNFNVRTEREGTFEDAEFMRPRRR